MTRTRSATAVVESPPVYPPPLVKQLMGSPDDLPLVPPVKPFAMPRRDRSGSDSSMSGRAPTLGTPGLKDVLKVGESNLYHPSC
jgi:hypothetical protein